MTIDHQKEVSKEVLKSLTLFIDSSAIIAGGAPRNWDHNLLARDVDIYLRTNVNDFRKVLTMLFNDGVDNLEFINLGEETSDAYMEALDFTIKQVISARYKGVTLQFIIINIKTGIERFSSRLIIDSFLVNISKIYTIYNMVTDSLEIRYSSGYMIDKGSNTLTILTYNLNGKQLYTGIQRYLPKIESYFPNSTVIFKD